MTPQKPRHRPKKKRSKLGPKPLQPVQQRPVQQQPAHQLNSQPRHSELRGAAVKLARAEKHLRELVSAIQAFLAANPYTIVSEEEPSTGDLVYRVKVNQQVPLEWGGVIGDIIHNLRAALDYVAWQLVISNGNTPTRRTAFPITVDAASFATESTRQLNGASAKAIRFVRRLRPYHGGDEVLWKLHRLDIVDKHQLILMVGAAHRNIVFKVGMNVPWQEEPVEFPEFALRPADTQFPLVDNSEVFRDKSTVGLEPLQAGSPKFTFEVSFGADEFPAGEAVLPGLEELIEHVTRIVDLVDRHLL